MKSIKTFYVLVFAVASLFFTLSVALASAPERLNYQGTLTDNNGNRITGTVTMIFNIYDQFTGGNLAWGPETIANVQVKDGLFSVVLGETVPVISSLFSSGNRYIAVTVNGEQMSPRQLINSVPYALNAIPSGVIVMWSGAVNNIPTGWVLCDGTNGTPDLRDRFIVGAGSSYSEGQTGGEATHTLSIGEIPSHNHGGGVHNHSASTGNAGSHQHHINADGGTDNVDHGIARYDSGGPDGAGFWSDANGDHSHGVTINNSVTIINTQGGGAAHENRPPYYALAFIMKL